MDNEKVKLMNEAVERIVEMIQGRLDINESALENGYDSPLDNLPDTVKISREQEASKMRAVKKEQKEIIQIIKLMFPKDAPGGKESKKSSVKG